MRGPLIVLAYVALYAVTGWVVGWKTAYDVMIGLTSPGHQDVSAPLLAWFLSLAGWLVAPAICGAVAGAVVSLEISRQRVKSIDEVLTKNGGQG